MRFRIFTLKFHTATEQFDDEDVQAFLKDKELLSIREHFFIKHETPYLALFVSYLPGTPALATHKKKRNAWREMLSNEQMPLFDALRGWRAERAKQDGVPPFVICSNLEFVCMVTERPDSLAGLMKIHGFGKAKTEKYGKELLALLSSPRNTRHETTHKGKQTTLKQQDSQQSMFEKQSEPATPVQENKTQGSKKHEENKEG